MVPTRNEMDTGYDLTIIRIEKLMKIDSDTKVATVMFDTGVRVRPPPNCYTIVVPRSSFCKLPNFELEMPNNPGIIDRGYQGTIKICLRNYPGTSDPRSLPLPFKGFQLIVMPLITPTISIISSFEEKTKRGEGGFGSTG